MCEAQKFPLEGGSLYEEERRGGGSFWSWKICKDFLPPVNQEALVCVCVCVCVCVWLQSAFANITKKALAHYQIGIYNINSLGGCLNLEDFCSLHKRLLEKAHGCCGACCYYASTAPSAEGSLTPVLLSVAESHIAASSCGWRLQRQYALSWEI